MTLSSQKCCMGTLHKLTKNVSWTPQCQTVSSSSNAAAASGQSNNDSQKRWALVSRETAAVSWRLLSLVANCSRLQPLQPETPRSPMVERRHLQRRGVGRAQKVASSVGSQLEVVRAGGAVPCTQRQARTQLQLDLLWNTQPVEFPKQLGYAQSFSIMRSLSTNFNAPKSTSLYVVTYATSCIDDRNDRL